MSKRVFKHNHLFPTQVLITLLLQGYTYYIHLYLTVLVSVPHGLVVRIAGSHPAATGVTTQLRSWIYIKELYLCFALVKGRKLLKKAKVESWSISSQHCGIKYFLISCLGFSRVNFEFPNEFSHIISISENWSFDVEGGSRSRTNNTSW